MAKKHSTGRKGKAAEDRQLDKIYDDFSKQPAQITWAQCKELEDHVVSVKSANAVARRAGLASLTKSGAQLVEAVDKFESAQAIAHAIVSVDRYIESLKSLISTMESASCRMALAMCNREDMYQLLDWAKAEQSFAATSTIQPESRQ